MSVYLRGHKESCTRLRCAYLPVLGRSTIKLVHPESTCARAA
jgi:hypothetical protein